MRNFSPAKRGFTMIEILVVITIIGILITLGIRSYMSSQMKARDLRRKADLHNLAKPLEAYFNDYGVYPLGSLNGLIVDDAGVEISWGEAFDDANNTVYMSQLPADPRGDRNYWYESDGTEWALYALFENVNDPDAVSGGFPGILCQALTPCNYQVSSTN